MEISNRIESFKEILDENYTDEIAEAIRTGKGSIEVDFKLIIKHNLELASDLLDYPVETFESLNIAVNEMIEEPDKKLSIRIKNIPKSELVPIRNVRSKYISKLIVIEGNIKNRSSVKPQVTKATFECPACGNIIIIIQLENNFREPTKCGCGRKGKFTLNFTEKIDFQYLSVEEPFDQLDEDSVPQRLGVMLNADLTDPIHQPKYIPGKPIKISGVLKDIPIITAGKKTVKLDWVLEANHCESLEENLTKTKFTDKEIQEFRKLSKDPNLYVKLCKSVAPHIYGHEKVKEAILLYLVKGVRKISSDGKSTREYMNILLMGDPGSAKSQLGNEIILLSWRCKKVVGKGASGPGLTASAERDEILNLRVLSAGAIPLCNEGHVVVDEGDKMEKEVSSHLHESMEDGKITINKSQVQGELKARTPVFMIGNPTKGRYDPYDSIISQIGLPKPLVNRFDLLFPVKDIPDSNKDNRLADTILEKHLNINSATKRALPLKLFKNYLCYVALNIKPRMTNEAAAELKTYFLKLRNQGNSDPNDSDSKNNIKNVGITGRQLDGLVRMAEAKAKLHMREKVLRDDARKAIELLNYSLQSFSIDPETGKVDIDRVITGITASDRSKMNMLKDIIKGLTPNKNQIVQTQDVVDEAKRKSISEQSADNLIKMLIKAGDITDPKPGFISRNV